MKLDSRILEGKRPLTCIDVEQAQEFVGKECIFSDKYENFENLDKYLFVNSDYSAILSIDDTPKCGDYVFRNAKNAAHYGLILPLEWVKEPEKKYRLFSLAEWIEQHEIGEIIHYRSKSEGIVLHHMYVGYAHGIDKDIQEIGVGTLTLGVASYSLDYLFEDYEIEVNGEWKLFGVEIEEQE